MIVFITELMANSLQRNAVALESKPLSIILGKINFDEWAAIALPIAHPQNPLERAKEKPTFSNYILGSTSQYLKIIHPQLSVSQYFLFPHLLSPSQTKITP